MRGYEEIQPAKAKKKRPDKLWGDPYWIAEEKLDGWRFLMHLGGGLERVYLTGRRTSRETGRLSEKGLLVPELWPDSRGLGYTVLDGEIMSPTGRWRDIAGIMNAGDRASAQKRIAEIGLPTFNAFDVLYSDGQDVRDLTLLKRRLLLTSTAEILGVGLIQPVPNELATYHKIVDAGGEGVILKNLFATYGESGAWVKVKKEPTVDVVVTGFTDAKFGVTGQYFGQIGAAKISVYTTKGQLVEVGKVSGMDDDTRRDMSDNPGRWIGTVIEVAAQEFAKDRLRHPRYRRRRDDADPRAATFTKMMADLQQHAEDDDDPMTQIPFPF